MAKKSFTANNVAFDAIVATSLAIATANVSGTLNVGANVAISTSGLNVGNTTANVVINSASVNVGANVAISTSGLNVGNSTSNVAINSASVKVGANVNLDTSGLNVGNSTSNVVINSTSVNVGANVNLDTSGLKVGNSTANVAINSSFMEVSNATYDATILPGKMSVSGGNKTYDVFLNGNSIYQNYNANDASSTIGTLTSYLKQRAGANNAVNDFIQVSYWKGLTTSGTIRNYGFMGMRANTANSTWVTGHFLIGIANSTGGLSYLTMYDNSSVVFQRDIIIGGTNINATSIDVGANVVLNTTTLRVGNTTANAHVNSTGFFLNGSAIGSNTQGMTATVFTANGTWTKPAGCKRIEVLVVGGGGGGGTSSFGNTVAGGGGGGGGGVIHFANAEALTTVAVVAGLGGAGGVGSAGSTGGTSSFGALASATGGGGGAAGAGSGAIAGGAGGVGSAGSVQINGQDGAPGNPTDGGTPTMVGAAGGSGCGGNSFLGAGGITKLGPTSQDGSAGGSYGGGGSGGWGWLSSANGGAGASGIVIVKEYY